MMQNGYTALFYALELPSTSIMKALLRRGANPNLSVTQKVGISTI